MPFVGLPAALLLALLPVQVESEECPQAAEIERALAGLLAPVPEGTRPDRARVRSENGLVHVELVNPHGAVMAERSIEQRGTCGEMAALVAVVVASWVSDVHPTFAGQAPEVRNAHRPPQPKPVATRRPSSFDIGVGVGLSFADSLELAGSTSATWVARGAGAGLRLSAAIDGERSVDLGQGQASWRRWMGSAEVDWRIVRGPASADLHGGPVLGQLFTRGVNFDANETRSSFAVGGALGVRLAWWSTRHFAVWFDVTAVLWLRRQSVYSASAEQILPMFQGLAQVGLAFGRGP